MDAHLSGSRSIDGSLVWPCLDGKVGPCYRNARSSRSLRTVLYIKRNWITFIQRLETGCVDARMVDEHIRATLLLNECVFPVSVLTSAGGTW